VPASTKITNGTTPAVQRFQLGTSKGPRLVVTACASTMALVDRLPVSRTTVATDRPRAAS